MPCAHGSGRHLSERQDKTKEKSTNYSLADWAIANRTQKKNNKIKEKHGERKTKHTDEICNIQTRGEEKKTKK